MQAFETISFVEQTPSPTQQDGKNDHDELIQKVPFEQGANERETAMHANALPGLLLQLSDRLGIIPLDDGCRPPCLDVAQGG